MKYEKNNAGTKGKSLKQDLTSAKDLSIELPEGIYIQGVCEKVVVLILNFGNKKIFKY